MSAASGNRSKLRYWNGRGVQLTPVGAAIFPAVQKLAEQLECLGFVVREAAVGQSGVMTTGAITSAMLDVLPDIVEYNEIESLG